MFPRSKSDCKGRFENCKDAPRPPGVFFPSSPTSFPSFLISLCTLSVYIPPDSTPTSSPCFINPPFPRWLPIGSQRAFASAHAHANRRPPGLRPPETIASSSGVGNRSFWPSADGAAPFLSRKRVSILIPGDTLPAYSGLGLRPLSYGGKGVPPSKIENWRRFPISGERVKKRLTAAPPSGNRREATV